MQRPYNLQPSGRGVERLQRGTAKASLPELTGTKTKARSLTLTVWSFALIAQIRFTVFIKTPMAFFDSLSKSLFK